MTARSLPAAPACYAWPLPAAPTGDPYLTLVRWHDGRCGLCGKPETARKNRGTAPRGLSEDHDHTTGMTRGFLCRWCNLHEGTCTRTDCACAAWRLRPAVDVLGVVVEHQAGDNSSDTYYRRAGIDPEEGRRAAMRRVADTLGSLFGDAADDELCMCGTEFPCTAAEHDALEA